MRRVNNIFWIILGWFALALSVLGIFLPLLPTTPLVILAGYFFSKGSPKLHLWLRQQKTFGPIIREWEDYGVIKPKAKIIATVMIVALFSYTLIFVKVNLLIKIIVTLIGVGVLTFIWTRPSFANKK